MKNLEEFLCLLDRYHITMMPILFNDCNVPKSRYRDPVLGKQPEPVKGFFGGAPETPFTDEVQPDGDKVGYEITDEPDMQPVVEKYVRELARKYGQDDRIIIWNIWNEPGNSERYMKSAPLMKKVFAWLREEDVKQPLTAETWGLENQNTARGLFSYAKKDDEIERLACDLSDIISFHDYGDYYHSKLHLKELEKYNRPLVNTEWMHRPLHSFLETHLPLWKKNKVGSYFFGFVNGKAQFDVVWEFLKTERAVDMRLWMHDIFHSDFTPYDEDEIAVLKECNRDKNIWNEAAK
jgi:hypothetical protein